MQSRQRARHLSLLTMAWAPPTKKQTGSITSQDLRKHVAQRPWS